MEFERLANRHKDAVYRQMVRMCGNHDDAEDVLVEALVKAYKASEGLKTEEAFQAWLAQIARRTCGRLRTRKGARPLLALADLAESQEPRATSESPVDRAMEAETKQCVQQALSTLSEEYREVYRLRDVEGWRAEQVADHLSISVAAVKSRLHRARAQVRAKLDESICGPFAV